jgi:CRISPR-associated endoribonuclease Cas6
MNRLYINCDSGNRPRFHIPWNYHLSLQSFIYDAIGEYDPPLATELHQFPHAPNFAFSEFIQTGPFSHNEDGLACERGYFVVTSDDDTILNAVANYATADGELSLGHTSVPVEGIEIEPVTPTSGETQFKTLSPIAVSERDPEETPREWYRPEDPMWFARLKDNVRDRFDAIHETGLPDNFRFKMTDIEWSKPKLLQVTNDIEIPCTRAGFTLDIDPATSQFIQTQGVGEKTGVGFGAVMPTDQIPAWWA